jgi:hypothetical protein
MCGRDSGNYLEKSQEQWAVGGGRWAGCAELAKSANKEGRTKPSRLLNHAVPDRSLDSPLRWPLAPLTRHRIPAILIPGSLWRPARLRSEANNPMHQVIPPILTVILGLTASRGVLAAAEELKSGPQPGESIPGPFHYLNVNGPHAGNPHCLVCEFGLRPAVLVFVREISADKSSLTNLLQKLDEAVDRYKNAELRAGVVVLNDDFANEQTRKELVRKLESSAKDLKHVLVALDGAAGPEKYKINKDVDVTVLLYNRHKVVANFAYAKDKLTDKDVITIMAAVKKTVGAK